MRSPKRPIVIGVAGGSGSGKTTYAELLTTALGDFPVTLIHTDNYFKEVKPRIVSPFSGLEYDHYDHPDAVDIDRLLADIGLSLASESTEVVIIEGLFVLYFEDVRSVLDLKLYVDCPSDERLIRRLSRDIHEETYDEITTEYLDVVRHSHKQFVEPTRWHADFVVNGSKISQTSVDLVRIWATTMTRRG